MALRHFALPDLGEGLTEADILGWLVAEGEAVKLNQPIVEVETAKAAVEVPSPWTGVVRKLLVPSGKTVAVGTPIISIDATADTDSPAERLAAEPEHAATEAMLVGYGPRAASVRRRPRVAAFSVDTVDTVESVAHDDVTVLAKPPVRKLARDLGVDLRSVHGSGPAGSITRADVDAVAGPGGHPLASREWAEHPAHGASGGNGSRIPIKGMRKAMAEAMTRSAFTAPHATVFLTVDATETLALRTALSGRPEFADRQITPLAVVARAVCVAARRAPLINSEWDESAGEIVVHEAINLGIAVASARGLLVPNIKDAGRLSLLELAGAIAELAATARAGHTRNDDLRRGTMSISNVGVFGVDTGTPILNPGESAILCLGAIRPRPWVHEGELAVREVVELSLAFDHRIIDGQVASQFLADVGAMLTDPRLLLALA